MRSDRVVNHLRSTKHAAWLARRAAWSAIEPGVAPAIDAGLRFYTVARPPRSELVHDLPVEPAPRRIFCLWTGVNPMSPNRVRAMGEIRRLNEPEVEVVLVTPRTLADWVVPDHPLHPAYEDLALIHRSDYLRTYLMHHHGGGYSDVKAARASWAGPFKALEGDPEAWMLGYPEVSYRVVAPAPKRLHRQLQVHYARLLGNGAYIARPRTPLTRAWLSEAERRLDLWRDDIARAPGEVSSGPPGYPVPFYGLLGEIFHPLCLRFHEHLRQDPRLVPQLHDYK
ncbi:hypothetical protein [Nocardioides astragali]|uniref:Capsular polysaccharide synthesis protein n=1 Tax=Nocardioides astragali TaxID=1776736 RepID=A0ABW2N4V6_9ACTN|nr:hypothetical protein [Nocardioides astragali]